MGNSNRPQDGLERRFNAFGGVFTPCTLTILGVIMYLRLGHVIGRAGILWAVIIVSASTVITLLTTLSLSAIATNTRVRGGGAYYLISRTLGVEFGGAIGIVFYFAQAISVALYVMGFSEAFVETFGLGSERLVLAATAVNVAVFICVYIGAGWTIRVQYVILSILGVSLVSFFAGAAFLWNPAQAAANLAPSFGERETLFAMFALFFPAVTGIMAGANMSGDLKDPAKAIPLGTLAAVGVTTVVYLGMTVMIGGARPREDLIGNTLVVRDIALWGTLITAGVFAATLSSALGSMMGAPRILQAFARDDLFRWLKVFAKGTPATNEPRHATVLTFAVSQTCILLGDLNAIAPVITMAFLITYGTINLATFYEAITKNPSYRPRFRFCHWSTSLLGAAGCLAVMFLIAPLWALASILCMALLHERIGRKEVEARWGDLQSGLLFERVRKNLLRLESEANHPKNWRPIILALSGGGWTRPHLAVYGYWFTAGNGMLSLGQVISGDIEDRIARRNNQERILRNFIVEEELAAFPAVVVAPTLSDGIESLVQCYGLGMLRPNTILLGWPTDSPRAESLCATLRTIAQLHRNIICVRFAEEPADAWAVPAGPIDVWWRGQENGALMLLLAYLISKNSDWRTHTIRLLRVIPNEAGKEGVIDHLRKLVEVSRIPAVPGVVVSENVPEAISRTSRNASLVFLGFKIPERNEEGTFYERMERMAGCLTRVVFVDSAGGMELDA